MSLATTFSHIILSVRPRVGPEMRCRVCVSWSRKTVVNLFTMLAAVTYANVGAYGAKNAYGFDFPSVYQTVSRAESHCLNSERIKRYCQDIAIICPRRQSGENAFSVKYSLSSRLFSSSRVGSVFPHLIGRMVSDGLEKPVLTSR